MEIVVCIKQTFDSEAVITLDQSGRISEKGVNLVINPYDEYALEEGLRIRERFGGSVAVVSVGGETVVEAARQALAMGADKAVVVSDSQLAAADQFTIAAVLAEVIEKLPYDLILGGWRSIDRSSAQVMVRLAERLGLPQVKRVTKLEVEQTRVTAWREIEGGTETVEVPLPAVITAQKGLNQPRYPSMKGIMQANRKEVKNMSLADLGLALTEGDPAKVQILGYYLPKQRQAARIIVGTAAEAARSLARILREEEKVL